MFENREKERELAYYKARAELLESQLQQAIKDKEDYKAQAMKLQDALMSVHSPDAYRDNKAAEAPVKELSAEDRERSRITREFTTQYLRSLEEPMFLSGDDLEDLINTGLVRDAKPPSSLHGNNES